MKGLTKRHLVVKIHIPAGGKQPGYTIEYAIDPDKVTEADRRWARRLTTSLTKHLAVRGSIPRPPEGEE